MNPYSDHAAGIRELIDELGDDCPTISYEGTTIKVLPDTSRTSSNLGLGGAGLDSDLEFTALLADFPETPVRNRKFAYSSRTYRVDNIHFAPGGEQVRISAVDANQRL